MGINYEEDIANIWSDLYYGKLSLREVFPRVQESANLSVVSINSSPICNLHCKHCFYGFDQPISKLLDFDEWKRIIDEFLDLGARKFHLCGKEPLTSRMTFKILTYLQEKSKKYSLSYGMITNGIMVNQKLKEIKDSRLSYLDFSIDGEEFEHDFLRGNGEYQKVIKNIDLAHSNELADVIWVSSVIHKRNFQSVVNLICNLSQKNDLRNFFIQPLQIHGKAIALESLELSINDYLNTLHLLIERLNDGTIRKNSNIVIFLPQQYIFGIINQSNLVRRAFLNYLEMNSSTNLIRGSTISFRFHLSCIAFWRTVQITPDGYYLGCSMALSSHNYWEYAIGNVSQSSIKDLFNNSLESSSLLASAYHSQFPTYCTAKPCFSSCFSGCKVFSDIRREQNKLFNRSCENHLQ